MLRWVSGSEGEQAVSGELVVGQIGQLAADPSTWWYSIIAVHMKHIGKGRGHVKSPAAARRAVERAWSQWLSAAALQSI